MKKEDLIRLKWLMEHYRKPMNQSMEGLLAERAKYKGGRLPDNSERPQGGWEGPFFCGIIQELLTPTLLQEIRSLVFSKFKKQERGVTRR